MIRAASLGLIAFASTVQAGKYYGKATEAPAYVPTEAPAYVPTEAPAYVPTDAPAYVPTDAPAYVPTEAPAYVPTDAPAYVPTEAPAYEATEAPYTTEPAYVTEAPHTAPPPFEAPHEPTYGSGAAEVCDATWKPNSAKYMAYVCSSLYATAAKWGANNCKAYYQVTDSYDTNALYQAHLCTYWTQRSIMRVVTSCFIEAHLRNEFIMKYGKMGPGHWWCKYSEFVNQVNDCYSSSLKYYPLGDKMNSLEETVAALNPGSTDMPAFKFTGSSVAMCAYYNKDQVYHRH